MRKTTVRILTGVAIVLVSLAAVYAIAVGVSARKLRRAYAALEKDNRPMRAADIIPAEVPDIENAALLYESAFLLLKAQPVGEKDLLEHLGKLAMAYANGSADPNQRTELRQLMQLEAVTSAIRAVQQGATRPACRFEHDYDSQGILLMPYLSRLRSFTGILDAKATLDAEAGRSDQAWDMVLTQLKFADALRTGPAFIVGHLVRVAQINSACMTIRRLCDNSVPTDEHCRRIQTMLEGFDDIAPLVLATDSERLLFGEWLFSLPKAELKKVLRDQIMGKSYVPEIFSWLQFRRICFKPLFLADHAAYLRLMRSQTGQLSRPYRRDDADTFDSNLFGVYRHHLLTGTIAPAMGRVKEIYLRMVAETRVTRTGLALLQYRDTHGDFPDTLDALGLEHTQDPFSQGPLLYRPEAESFILYSVGQDQKDNGGSPRQPKGDAEYDLVWRFPSQPDR